jgi:hypothetical protein
MWRRLYIVSQRRLQIQQTYVRVATSKVGGLSGRLGRARYPVARPKSVKPEDLYAVIKGPPGRTYQGMTALRRGGCPKESVGDTNENALPQLERSRPIAQLPTVATSTSTLGTCTRQLSRESTRLEAMINNWGSTRA